MRRLMKLFLITSIMQPCLGFGVEAEGESPKSSGIRVHTDMSMLLTDQPNAGISMAIHEDLQLGVAASYDTGEAKVRSSIEESKDLRLEVFFTTHEKRNASNNNRYSRFSIGMAKSLIEENSTNTALLTTITSGYAFNWESGLSSKIFSFVEFEYNTQKRNVLASGIGLSLDYEV
ncbi:MAG: hypothetical protein OXT67_04600 [Zetaproteobacteria bacterium]|nr:hypothetical protein [Zetaproteobacteria bacterium]